jgi:hypothetical protein
VNGNIKLLLRRGRGYKILRYLLLKAQRIAATKTDCGLQESRLKMRLSSNSCRKPFFLPSPPYLDATSERALIRYHDRALNALPKTLKTARPWRGESPATAPPL